MNLELPFACAEPSALDDCLAAMEDELDARFLDEVGAALRRARAERELAADDAAA